MGPVGVVGVAEPLVDRLVVALPGGFPIPPGDKVDRVIDGIVVVPARCGPDDAAVDLLRSTLRSPAALASGHWVVVSSAEVHTPDHHHPGWVGEDYRGRGARKNSRNPVSKAWRRLESTVRETAREAAEPPALTILRPATVLVPGGTDPMSRLFARRVALVPAGFDPSVQLLAVGDLVAAVRAAVDFDPTTWEGGVFHVAPDSALPLSRALAHAGVRRIGVPGPLVDVLLPAGRGDFLRHTFTVSATRWRRAVDLPVLSDSTRVAEAAGIAAGRVDGPADEVPRYDPHGLDEGYVRRLGRWFFRFLHDAWWRNEVRGFEHVPREGKAVLVGVHRGHQPWDGIMTLHLCERRIGRCPRFLIHPTLVKFPFLAPYMIRCGGVHACRENGDQVLDSDEILAIFPEGIRGAFVLYEDAYRLQRFGRDEYVKFALRHGAPIVPYVILGSAEIFPILARVDWAWWRRVSEWPFLPITPTMSLLPLPSKWHTWFLEPIPVAAYGPEAAEDPEIVRALSETVRERLQAALDTLRARRPAIFWGSIFDDATFAATADDATGIAAVGS